MVFSATVQQAFDGWINVSTWYTWHPLDEGRFHSFVWAAADENCATSEYQVEKEIIDRCKGKLHEEHLLPAAKQAATLYRTLMDFAASRNNDEMRGI